jgi:ribokinase
MAHIVVVGSSNTDLVVPVSRIPAPGETVLGGALTTVAGGKGANQAVAAARLGGAVTFIARVGDDAYGAAARAGFVAEGIGTKFVATTAGVASGVALIAVASSGENCIVVAPGANAHLSAADIVGAAAAFDSAAAVVISLEIPDDAVFAAVRQGKSRGVPVILNPAPARPLPPEILAKIAVLTPNETELAQLGGVDALLRSGVGTVVTTLGADGAAIATAAGTTRIPAIAVQAVDTVAAGDTFTGALAVELSQGVSIDDAVRFACAAAALKVTRPGAQPGIPSRSDVDRFLALAGA